MPSTIRDFYRVAQERDFARQNQLRVVTINSGAGFNIDFSEDDLVYVKTARLPNRTIQTSDATYMGLDFRIPGNVKYEGSANYELTFFCDQTLDLWDKFNEWTSQIFDDETSTGNYFAPKASSLLTLMALDNELNPIKKYNLIGFFPKSVGELNYDISDAGQIHTFTANCAYHFWTEDNI